jgi:hypothetical protein
VTQIILTDDQIAALTPRQRRELIRRLERPVEEVMPHGFTAWFRRAHFGVMTAGALCLIPWIVYLGFTLPITYTVRDWPLTWIGFDSLLVTFMAATAVLAWLHRQLLTLTAFTTGILLICDAWFDITTASPAELRVAVLTAALGGLPLAFLLIAGTLSLLRFNATRTWLLEPGQSLWRLPLAP